MPLAQLIAAAWPWLLAAILATARPIGMLAVHPVLARAQLAGLLRGGVVVALALPEMPHLARDIVAGSNTTLLFVLLATKEVALGAIIGFFLGVPFWAFQFAGDLLDQQRSATSGRLNDPAGFEDVSITGTLLVVTAATLFVVAGGLRFLASTLYASWAIWRPLASMPSPTADTLRVALQVLEVITGQGLLLAAPVVIAMLLADMTLLLVARFAPQLRVGSSSSAARNLLFYIALLLYVVMLTGYMRDDLMSGLCVLPNLQSVLR